jgi:C-terminal processing protease CtpA/Prc
MIQLRTPTIAFLTLALTIACCGQWLSAAPTQTPPPTQTPTPTTSRTPTPTFAPTPTLTPMPPSLLEMDEPFLITGKIVYTSPFFRGNAKDAFVLLEDEAGFVRRDKAFEFPLESQVLGPVQTGRGGALIYSLLLPAVPQGTFVDVDHDGEDETGVQVFAVAYWPNIWGGTFLERREGTGWSSAHTSALVDSNRDYEITGGILIVWAPDGQQGFPIGFGQDGLLFTDDDPIDSLPAGYTIVDLNETPFKIYKEPQPTIDLYEGETAVTDYSDLDYEEAFDALFEQMSRKYPFTEEKGIDWDALYEEYAPRVARARSEEDFYRAIRDFTWAIPDGHVGLGGGSGALQRVLIDEQGGGFGLAVTELSDGRIIATTVLPDLPAANAGVEIGAEITAWNGKPIGEAIEEVVPYFGPYSTEHTRRLNQVLFLTRVSPYEEITVTYRNSGRAARQVTMNAEVEFDSLIEALPAHDEVALPVEGEVLDDSSLGYIQITTFAGNSKLTTDLWEHYMEGMIDAAVPGLIIDLRLNSGGSGGIAMDLASYFFEGRITLGYWWRYNDLAEEFEPFDIPLRIEPAPRHYRGPVVLLVSPDCASACEGFAYAMTLRDRATVIGHYPTAGAFGAVERGQVELPDGLVMQFPTTKVVTPDGEVIIEGVGVAPDIVVPVTEKSALGLEDAVLNAAIEALAE